MVIFVCLASAVCLWKTERKPKKKIIETEATASLYATRVELHTDCALRPGLSGTAHTHGGQPLFKR